MKLHPPTPFHLALLVLNVGGTWLNTSVPHPRPPSQFEWFAIGACVLLCIWDVIGFRRKGPLS